MSSHWMFERLESFGDRPAFIWQGEAFSYRTLCDLTCQQLDLLKGVGVGGGRVVAMSGDYSPAACAFFIAAVVNRNIIVPLTAATSASHDRMQAIAEVSAKAWFDETDRPSLDVLHVRQSDHPLLQQIASDGKAGLVLFTSGSSGAGKAVLLDLDRLLTRFKPVRPPLRTLVFLQLDHIGGINTMLYVLCNGGTLVRARERTVDAICTIIDHAGVELLPTTPTFLRMMLIADATKHYSLRSLTLITYGTEPMPENTLLAAQRTLPWVRFKQTYGLSELGILPSQSESAGSTWIKLGSGGFELRVEDGTLWIRSPTAMLGYLNAPSPFTEDGWFNTQDAVEVRGDYLRILGRKSEFINVGGEKVHPAEVENILLAMSNVRDVTAFGRPNPVTGQVVCARVTLQQQEDASAFRQRLREFCRGRMPRYKIPVAVEVIGEEQHSYRFKKLRRFAKSSLPSSW
jgi:acyl-CoA synthetase (AMP-forming)/AMP-acid ligase II